MDPTPVEVVKTPRGPGPLRRIADAVPGSVVGSVATAVLLAWWAPNIAAYVMTLNPTCEDPSGLEILNNADVTATASYEEEGPAARVLDGDLGGLWQVPMVPADDRPSHLTQAEDFAYVDRDESELRLSLEDPADVELVCVVNGLGSSYGFYTNWARVRSVSATTDANTDAIVSVLRSQNEYSFQEFQAVAIPSGSAREVVLQVRDVYQGQEIVSYDPDRCGTRASVGEGVRNDPVGCNFNPTAKAGIAELRIYERRHSRLATLFGLD